jgi:hypothetical protein
MFVVNASGDLEVLCGVKSAEMAMSNSAYDKSSWHEEKEAKGLRRMSIFRKSSSKTAQPAPQTVPTSEMEAEAVDDTFNPLATAY